VFSENQPWRGDRLQQQRELQPFTTYCLSPLRGLSFFLDLNLGLTPQAMCMSPLRGSSLTRQLGLTTIDERRADSVFDTDTDRNWS
jgi:hypothetical protein